MVKKPPTNVGDMDLIPDPGRSHMLWSSQAAVPQPLSPRLEPVLTRKATYMRSLSTVTREKPAQQ